MLFVDKTHIYCFTVIFLGMSVIKHVTGSQHVYNIVLILALNYLSLLLINIS